MLCFAADYDTLPRGILKVYNRYKRPGRELPPAWARVDGEGRCVCVCVCCEPRFAQLVRHELFFAALFCLFSGGLGTRFNLCVEVRLVFRYRTLYLLD